MEVQRRMHEQLEVIYILSPNYSACDVRLWSEIIQINVETVTNLIA